MRTLIGWSLLAAFVLIGSLLSGCGSNAISEAIPDQRLAYKQQREAAENLEIPPDLVGSRFNDELDIPSVDGAATYSEYSGGRAQRQRVSTGGTVLPTVPDVEQRRRGDERWLEVRETPQQVWPRLVAFWRDQGILLVEQDPAVGIMRTDWLDNRAEIRQDFVTRMVSKVVEGVYATSTRDQYSLRIERGQTPGTTEVYLTHRGMEERLVTNAIGDGSRTIWEPSRRNTEKEAEMLRRLTVFLGGAARQPVAEPGGIARGTGSRARLVTEGGVSALVLEEDFRRAWRSTGLALDRAGFAVEDRDRSQGVYLVRYAGAAGQERPADKPGLMSRMAFWRKKPTEDEVGRYQVRVAEAGEQSRVTVSPWGEGAAPGGSERILGLLQEQF